MALLKLNNVGKIYVSEGNVSVGVRGINLSFDIGEFVAITGKSGSGKSTILNILSGMDSYEEGEYYVEGKPTSHYNQSDWEEFREKYISFIFQDYNIIESFTVLQNVELALLNTIDDPKKRKAKAIELIKRVGLEKQMKNKGSKLSGGQKQRTVIARALAKDSKILLADEPTGNLDSESGKEIMKLLKEVSEDKLVIVVTHNFDEIESFATRQVRIFDGSVEFDHQMKEANIKEPNIEEVKKSKIVLKKAFKLGLTRFIAMPKLTIYIVSLMTLAVMALTYISTEMSETFSNFKESPIFTHYDGRLVLTKKDNTPFNDEDFNKINNATNPKQVIKFDYYFDNTITFNFYSHYWSALKLNYITDDIKLSIGKMPEHHDEVVLTVPIGFPEGEDIFKESTLPYEFKHEGKTYKVTGVKFFYDNTLDKYISFTKEGYDELASTDIASRLNGVNVRYYNTIDSGIRECFYATLVVDKEMEPKTYSYIDKEIYDTYVSTNTTYDSAPLLEFKEIKIQYQLNNLFKGNNASYEYYDYDYEYKDPSLETINLDLTKYQFKNLPVASRSLIDTYNMHFGNSVLYVSSDIYEEIINHQIIDKLYPQASVFYKNDKEAKQMMNTLNDLGYFTYLSNVTQAKDTLELLLGIITGIISLGIWIVFVFFISLLLYACTSKAMASTKGDIAIMRSMGISTNVIKQSIVIQLIISILPAIFLTAILFTTLYMLPKTNFMFTFIHVKECLLLLLLLSLICYSLSRSYIKLMFSSSVKKTLKGGIKG